MACATSTSAARGLIRGLDAIEAVHRAVSGDRCRQRPVQGAGFELALACDLRVAASSATFGLPVRVGVPSVIQAALLPPMIEPGRAAEMLRPVRRSRRHRARLGPREPGGPGRPSAGGSGATAETILEGGPRRFGSRRS